VHIVGLVNQLQHLRTQRRTHMAPLLLHRVYHWTYRQEETAPFRAYQHPKRPDKRQAPFVRDPAGSFVVENHQSCVRCLG
jgi:hypothetical protein